MSVAGGPGAGPAGGRTHPAAGARAPVPLTAGLYAALLAGAFLVYASANAPVPVSAELRERLGMGGSGAALFLLPFAAGFGVGALGWFAAARRSAPRVLLPLSLAGGALASAGLLVAGSAAGAVAARALVGAAAAGYPAVAQAVISHGVAPARRGRLIGGFVAAVVAGSFIGQAITGALADALSVTAAVALVCVAAPLAVALVLVPRLPRGRSGATAAADAGGGRRRTAALLGHQSPVLAVAALAFGGYWLMLSELPEALREDRYHLTAAQAGALPTIGLVGVATALAAGRAADVLGPRIPMLVTLAAGVAGLALTLPSGVPLWLFALGYGVFLVAYWAYLPPASAEVARRSSPADRQAALMAFYAAMWIGAAVAPAASALMGWTGAAILTLAAWALALVPATRFGRRDHHL